MTRPWIPFLLLLSLPGCRWERAVTVGDRGGVLGGGFNMSVSREFTRDSLQTLYARAISEDTQTALADFTCGDPVPPMRYEMTLQPEGRSNERLVEVGFAPDLYPSNREPVDKYRCLTSGLSYVFEELLAEIDTGPPIDYGYVNPSTGQPLGPLPLRSENRKPICRCDLRDSGREWVAHSEEAAAKLR